MYLSAEIAAWAVAFGLGEVVKSGVYGSSHGRAQGKTRWHFS